MQSSLMSAFTFRPLTRDDRAMVQAWFERTRPRAWPRDERVRVLVACLGDSPIGLVEWARLGDFPALQHAYRVTDACTARCDAWIGEPSVAYLGLGPALMRAFLERVVFAEAWVTGAVVAPSPDDAHAIRGHELAGFRFVRARRDDGLGNPVYLMELSRGDLSCPRPEAAAFFIRPGRERELSIAVEIDEDAWTSLHALGAQFAIALGDDEPLLRAERARWAAAARAGRLLFACSADGMPVGFAVLDLMDDAPHLQQVSVRRAWGQRGIGRMLVERALRWSVRAGELWLTTYDHVPWNLPWYQRLGFVAVADPSCGIEMRAALDLERSALPDPAHRVAMVHRTP